MDALQPSGSFKIRGIGYHCTKAVRERGCTRLVSSSGGNAGLAVAYSGRRLGVPVTVVGALIIRLVSFTYLYLTTPYQIEFSAKLHIRVNQEET